MKAQEQINLDTLSLVFLKKYSVEKAIKVLIVSKRSIGRYLRSYKSKGVLFAAHGNTGVLVYFFQTGLRTRIQ